MSSPANAPDPSHDDASPSSAPADAAGSASSAEQRRQLEEQHALDMMEEAESRQWG